MPVHDQPAARSFSRPSSSRCSPNSNSWMPSWMPSWRPSAHARRTRAASLAHDRYAEFLAGSRAVEAQESVLEVPAAQQRLEFPDGKRWRRRPGPRSPLDKLGEVLLHNRQRIACVRLPWPVVAKMPRTQRAVGLPAPVQRRTSLISWASHPRWPALRPSWPHAPQVSTMSPGHRLFRTL